MKRWLREPARPADTWVPVGIALGLTALLVILARSGSEDPQLRFARALGSFLGLSAWPVGLALAGREDLRRRRRTALAGLAWLASTILVFGYLVPWLSSLELRSPDGPETWLFHRQLAALVTGSTPAGEAVAAEEQEFLVFLAWRWASSLLTLGAAFLPGLLPRRIRIPWWLNLASVLLLRLPVPGLAALAMPDGRSGPRQLLLAAPMLIVAGLLAAAAWCFGSRPGEGAAGPASAAGRRLSLRRLAFGGLAVAAGILLVLALMAGRHPMGWRGLLLHEGQAVGIPAPDFALASLDGGSVSLSELRGRVVVVNLWATWCGPCREELPQLARLRRELRSERVSFLCVNRGEATEPIRSFLAEQALELDVLLSTPSMLADYSDGSIPKTYVIDAEGRIRHRHDGFGEGLDQRIEEEVRALLAAVR